MRATFPTPRLLKDPKVSMINIYLLTRYLRETMYIQCLALWHQATGEQPEKGVVLGGLYSFGPPAPKGQMSSLGAMSAAGLRMETPHHLLET